MQDIKFLREEFKFPYTKIIYGVFLNFRDRLTLKDFNTSYFMIPL